MFGRKDDGPLCPLIGGKPCIRDRCKFWVRLLGKHPQTGAPIDHFDCAVSWLPVLLVEGAQESRQTAAAVESFRNEMVRQNELHLRLTAADLSQYARLGGGNAPRDDRS